MEENSATTPAKPVSNRRWFQYSLRTLLILTTFIAVVISWWLYKAREQREAVAALTKAGGNVVYNFEVQDEPHRLHCPMWLVDVLGVDYVASVISVGFYNQRISATQLEAIDALSSLEGLYLNRSQITDIGLEHVKGLTGLEELDLGDTQVSDAGLESLEGLTALRWIRLVGTQVTDAGAARLQKVLPNCSIIR